jgi:hypothetical protein
MIFEERNLQDKASEKKNQIEPVQTTIIVVLINATTTLSSTKMTISFYFSINL